MGRSVRVSLESFGNSRLTAVMDADELRGRSVENVVRDILQRQWGERETETRTTLERAFNKGNYFASVITGGQNLPARKERVDTTQTLAPYVGDPDLPQPHIRLSITPDQVVGYAPRD